MSINIRHLNLEYKNFKALSDVSLEIEKGRVFGLLGPNGAGKTSLVKLLTGLLRPSSGTVDINGKESCRHLREIKALFGLVPQESALYDELSAYANCEFQASLYDLPARRIKTRIEEVLELVDLRERMKDRVKTFSGGMKRRLAIGKALLHDPEILILDEPTLGVDVQGTHKIWDYIISFADKGKTIIVTTNVMNEADRLADQLCILDHGQVIVKGTPGELKRQLGEREIILDYQDPVRAEKAREILKQEARVHKGKLIINSTQGTEDLIQIIKILPEAYRPKGIELKEPTLDDVFLSFTGRRLRD